MSRSDEAKMEALKAFQTELISMATDKAIPLGLTVDETAQSMIAQGLFLMVMNTHRPLEEEAQRFLMSAMEVYRSRKLYFDMRTEAVARRKPKMN